MYKKTQKHLIMCKVAQHIVSGLNVRSSRYKNKSMIVSDYAIWPILIFLLICIKHTSPVSLLSSLARMMFYLILAHVSDSPRVLRAGSS